jgi:hypothetical protein
MRAGTRRLFVIVLFLLVPAAGAPGQTPYDPDRNQALGLIIGAASGAGVAYEEVLPSGFGYRGALMLWSLGDSSFVDAGVTGLRLLGDDRGQRVYLLGSFAYWRRSEEEREGDRVFDDVDDSWSLGLGAGLQVPAGEHWAVTLEAAFTYWADSGALLPLPHIGIDYRF